MGDGVLVGMTAADGVVVLTGTGAAVGMGVDSMVGMGSCEVTDESVSPAALPRPTNTAAMVTADTMKSTRTTGITGKEWREANS